MTHSQKASAKERLRRNARCLQATLLRQHLGTPTPHRRRSHCHMRSVAQSSIVIYGLWPTTAAESGSVFRGRHHIEPFYSCDHLVQLFRKLVKQSLNGFFDRRADTIERK